MTAEMRRGACPSLSTPMQTGDGLLARLNPPDGALSAAQLDGLAAAAKACGNGMLEISARGGLQIRGLTGRSAEDLAEAVAALSIAVRPGVDVRSGALAGLDAEEIGDPRPLASAIREASRAFSARLAPKASVIVDGGGALPLCDLIADVRLEALGRGEWLVRVGGTAAEAKMLGKGDAHGATNAAIRVLRVLAGQGPEARGRDLDAGALRELAAGLDTAGAMPAAPPRLPVGRFALKGGGFARGFALPFGQIDADALASLAQAAGADGELRLAPGRGLLALNDDPALTETARRLGLVTEADDPRLRIAACAGSPACASARLPARAIARSLAASWPAAGPALHVSGCAKQCAKPAGPAVVLIGGPEGYRIAAEGTAIGAAARALLARVAQAHGAHPQRHRA